MSLYAATVRVYFNSKEAFPNVWSVDFGLNSVEINCSAVLTGGIHLTSRYDPDAVPCAWLEGYDAEVEIIINEVVITERTVVITERT